MNLLEFVEENRKTLTIGLMGLFLLIVGLLSAVILRQSVSAPDVEILTSDESQEETPDEVVVDVEGAVEEPGLFKLQGEVRVNDALMAAGGLAADADREWVEINLNLAQKVSDGVKIYIPAIDERMESEAEISVGDQQDNDQVLGFGSERKININNASKSELEGLWGIGEKRAETIMESRPFNRIEELMEKQIIPENVFERIKTEIVVF